MKKLLFFASMCPLFVLAGCGSTGAIPAQEVPSTPTTATTTPSGYTMQDVQKHNTSADCWTVVQGKIYNMSDFASLHSGGPDKIISVCGKDGTTTFAQQHGTDTSLIANYFLADLQK